MNWLVRLVITAVALWVATLVVPDVQIGDDSFGRQVATLLLVAVIFGVVNAVIKPVVRVVAFPLYLLTLGLITFVVNAALFWLSAWVAGELGLSYEVKSFVGALFGALVVGIVSFGLTLVARQDR